VSDANPGSTIAGAAVGACLFGFADAASVAGGSGLALSESHKLLLLLLDGGTLAIFGALAALPLLAVPALRSAWSGFLWGLFVGTMASLGEWWFTAPPSFVDASGTEQIRGNAALFALTAAGLGAIYAGLAAALSVPRHRIGVAIGITFTLATWGLSADRDLLPLGRAPDAAPNVLLVTLDTTRADHFGAYGHELIQTPSFDALAAQGARIADATSPIPVTGPAHTTIMTGQQPWSHGALLNGVPVNSGVAMMAEHLRARGWRTGAFVSAYVLDGALGFGRGFEVYDDDFSWLQGWAGTLPGRYVSAATRRLSPAHVLERRGGYTVDQALDWMEPVAANVYQPFFAWVHLFDPHGPYAPPPPWDTVYYDGDPRDPAHASMEQVGDVAAYLKPSLDGITDLSWVLAQYAGEISYTDEQLGRLLTALDDWGVANNTLVVVVGDHGESLTEHGVWFNHGDDLFAPSVHVPMAFRFPGKIPREVVVKGPVELGDVAPTVYELLDIEPPDSVEGTSLLGALHMGIFTGRQAARGLTYDRAINLAERRAGNIDKPVYRMVSLRRPGDYLYIHRDAEGAEDAYYDLSAEGRGEDAVAPMPSERDALPAEAAALLEAMAAEDLDRSAADPDAEMEARLRALGYIE